MYKRDPFLVSVVFGLQLEKFCKTIGVDFSSSCRALDIDPAIFMRITGQLTCYEMAALFEELARQACEPNFGLKAAMEWDLGAMGPLSPVIRSAKDMRTAWLAVRKYRQIGLNFLSLELVEHSQSAEIIWEPSPYSKAMPQLTDFAAALNLRLFSVFGNPDDDLIGFRTTRVAPIDPTLHYEIFSNKIVFGQKSDVVVVVPDLLDRPNPAADFMTYKYMQLQCVAAEKFHDLSRSIETETRRVILSTLSTGEPSLDAVAKSLAVSSRSLQRKLGDKGISFSQLVDDTRKNYAEHLLENSKHSIDTIAHMVGFKSTSVLSRAARVWFGVSPSQYRKENRSCGQFDLTRQI